MGGPGPSALSPGERRRRMSPIQSGQSHPLAGAYLRMIERRYVFPGVIEMNYQAKRRMGVNIYLIDGGSEFALIDVGFLDELADVLELIRQMDFSLSACKMIIATHADVDHTQGLTRAREVLKCEVAAHPKSVAAIEVGRRGLHLRPHRRPGNSPADHAVQGRPGDQRGRALEDRRQDAAKSGAPPGTPTASLRFGWATCFSRATTSFATAASA